MKHFNYTLLTAVALVFFSTAPLAEVYKGKDSQGNIIYSDKPFTGAEKVDVELSPTYTAPPITTKLEATKKAEPIAYQLSILSPSQDQTFTNEITTITVSVSISPGLQQGDKIQLLLNGQPHGAPTDATSFTLDSLYRGAYTVQAVVINEANPNVPLAKSNDVTFYQKRPMIH
ncbi:MAG: DUF4124 domain-containing protein [Candidatus Berkiella sp.]